MQQDLLTKNEIFGRENGVLFDFFHAFEEFFGRHFMTFIDFIQIDKCNIGAYFIPAVLRSGNIRVMSKAFLAGIPCRYSEFTDTFSQ